MRREMRRKIIKSSTGVLLAVLLFMTSGTMFPFIDRNADEFFKNAASEAALAYATCRLINASVSVIKESHLQLEPAGIGVSFAIGQILDPIDDMTERLSDVLVTAIVSFGIQKLFYEISIHIAPQIIAIIILIFSILVWSDNKRLKSIRKTVFRVALLTIVLRFFLPLAATANDFINIHFFQDKISEARNELVVSTSDFSKLRDFSFPEINGVMGTIKSGASILKQKTIEFRDALKSIDNQMKSIIGNLLKLTWLYAAVFLIQVILSPLLMFWLLTKMTNALFSTDIPPIIHNSDIFPGKPKAGNVQKGDVSSEVDDADPGPKST
ncbi:MAG: hypothetical protein GY850_04105 [bacterium]|nr:hypothetical protein [bacterium]